MNTDEEILSKAPNQVTLGIKSLEGVYVDDRGHEQPWKAYYDDYSRLVARTDFNAGNIAAGILDTHYHTYVWESGMTPMEVGKHLGGEFIP